MGVRTYTLEDGRTLHVCIEVGQWSAWLANDSRSQVIGLPLEGVLREVIGLNPAHDEVPPQIARIAERVRADVPRADWPSSADCPDPVLQPSAPRPSTRSLGGLKVTSTMRPGQLKPNDFELAILERLASRESSIRLSVERLHVLSREFTGVGSFT